MKDIWTFLFVLCLTALWARPLGATAPDTKELERIFQELKSADEAAHPEDASNQASKALENAGKQAPAVAIPAGNSTEGGKTHLSLTMPQKKGNPLSRLCGETVATVTIPLQTSVVTAAALSMEGNQKAGKTGAYAFGFFGAVLGLALGTVSLALLPINKARDGLSQLTKPEAKQ